MIQSGNLIMHEYEKCTDGFCEKYKHSCVAETKSCGNTLHTIFTYLCAPLTTKYLKYLIQF